MFALQLIYAQSRGEGAVSSKLCKMPPNMSWPAPSSALPWSSLVQRKKMATEAHNRTERASERSHRHNRTGQVRAQREYV